MVSNGTFCIYVRFHLCMCRVVTAPPSTGPNGNEVSIEVTFGDMVLHLLATVVGWVGLWWFYKRQKRGAYTSIAAHLLGFTAVMTQTPEMMKIMPPAAIAVFFALMFAVTLGPIFKFKDQYS